MTEFRREGDFRGRSLNSKRRQFHVREMEKHNVSKDRRERRLRLPGAKAMV